MKISFFKRKKFLIIFMKNKEKNNSSVIFRFQVVFDMRITH